MSLEDYLPRARVEPQRRRYIGSGDAEVHTKSDGSHVLITSRTPPPPIPQTQSAAAVDIYANIDFRTFLTDGGLRVNPGEISSVSWSGFEWVQEVEVVPETEIAVTATTQTKYLHLIVPVQTFEPAPLDTPWYVEERFSYLTATPYSFARANSWQGLNGTPYYEITISEEPPNIVVPGTVPHFDVMLASLHSTNGLRVHHCGPVNLSQGYLARLVSI